MKDNPTRSAFVLIDMENGFVDRRGGHLSLIQISEPPRSS